MATCLFAGILLAANLFVWSWYRESRDLLRWGYGPNWKTVAPTLQRLGEECVVMSPWPFHVAYYSGEFPDYILRKKQVEDTPEAVFLSVFWIYATTEMGPWLNEITCPCLVLTGELDGGCNPRLNEFMHAQLPDSRLVILDGIKHSILVEGPERVIPHVREFLLGL